ncbi:AdoMet-homocysteine methyltransferase [Coniosporium apollinis]|uniref:AdoMet-homocysteine methyltransferase n=1 Tax=Coniosporium apollinis TaxID=61459 RepID=A0ABQ9NQW6_9PEZI|nr:AdoMet-homocysteine methyltransferase [Coniosporium apollinis]
MSSNKISEFLAQRELIVLDGALATELEARGLNLNDPSWSAKALLGDTSSLIRDVHLDYFRAGADVAITASYQASTRGLHEHLGLGHDQSIELITKSVRLAQEARDIYLSAEEDANRPTSPQRCNNPQSSNQRPLLIAGSTGPYGAYLANGSEYTGTYSLSRADFHAFHRPRIQALLDAGVDLLALETQPSFPEILALVDLLAEFPDAGAWVSMTLRDAERLSDGTSIGTVLERLNESSQVLAVGVNCVPEEMVTAALRRLRGLTNKPLMCYPNSGEVYDAVSKTWGGTRAEGERLAERVREWRKAGAVVIGGCCRTGPKDIRTIVEACREALP